MRRRLLVITKEPEFDVRGEVVLGQCEPFTSGWTLWMITPERQRECLIVGTYTDLRKIQESCLEISDPKAVRKRVNDMRALMLSSVTETVVYSPSHPRPDGSETQELKAVGLPETPKQTPGGLLKLQPSGNVLVATVAQPDRADDTRYLKDELMTVLDCHPKAVLVDLSKVSTLSAISFKELAGIRDQFRRSGADFVLCSLTHSMMQKIQTMKSKDALRVFEDQAKALAVLGG
ncbi:MAG TPA: STAS domain-containing protein [Planctomycetota bacterium]|jgi:anti-anti-sigma regulatory factor